MWRLFYDECPLVTETIEHPYSGFSVSHPKRVLERVVITNDDDLVNIQSFTHVEINCPITKPVVLTELTHVIITSRSEHQHSNQIQLVQCDHVVIDRLVWKYEPCFDTAVGTGTTSLAAFTQKWPIGAVFWGTAKIQIAMEARPIKAENGVHPAFATIPAGEQAVVWKSRSGQLPAIQILGCENVSVLNCMIENYPQTGVSISEASKNVLVKDCFFHRGRADGVMVNSADSNIAVIGNAVSANGDDGISVFAKCWTTQQHVDQIQISGRWLVQNRASVNCVVRDNILTGNSCRGISYQSPFGCIERNMITVPGKEAIKLWRDDAWGTGPYPHFTVVDGIVWTAP